MKPISDPRHEAKESAAVEKREHRTGKEAYPPKRHGKRGKKRGGKRR